MTHLLSIQPNYLLLGAIIILLASAVFVSHRRIRIAVVLGAVTLLTAFASAVSLVLLIAGVTP